LCGGESETFRRPVSELQIAARDVERTIAWLHNFRRLHIRFERLPIIHEAFISIACCLICWRTLRND